MLRAYILASLALIPVLAACTAASGGSTTNPEIEGTRISKDAMKGGCRVVCPKCIPNQPCPMWPCHIECPPKVTPCGDTVCTGGQVCCNASCGICTQPDMFCTMQACEPAGCNVIALCVEGYVWSDTDCACVPVPTCTSIAMCIEGYVWSDKDCACVPVPAECTTDADCHAADDYCGGCNCIALATNETGPTCTDPVQCFAQPCAVTSQTPACVGGQCVMVDAVTQ